MTQNHNIHLLKPRLSIGIVAAVDVLFAIVFFRSAISNLAIPSSTELTESVGFHRFSLP
jgi:hypothetical protein